MTVLWVLVVIAGVVASELLLRLPVLEQIRRVVATSAKVSGVLKSRHISDHWKERILPAYAWVIGKSSITFLVLLLVAVLPVALLGMIYPGGWDAWLEALVDPVVIAVLCLVSLAYIWLRSKNTETGASTSADYSAIDRILHWLSLGLKPVAEMSHDIERARFLASTAPDDGRHVFVTGLARAGTTVLMREIYRTGVFGSLTYADMPFVLAPNLWAGLSSKGSKPGRKAERAHGDGIEVDTHSPEALDEVFWRVFDGDAYISKDALKPHEPDPEVVSGYRDLIRLVLKRTGHSRYVSKNNNNILRLPTLAAAMPQSHILVPLRNPLTHAASLLNQHVRFSKSDRFTRRYMTWLGHHEFGATHLPLALEGWPQSDPSSLNYWLAAWIAVHRRLDAIEAVTPNVCFVPYEALSSNPQVWKAVAERIGVEPKRTEELRIISDHPPGEHDPQLAAEAKEIYARLVFRGFQKLGLSLTA